MTWLPDFVRQSCKFPRHLGVGVQTITASWWIDLRANGTLAVMITKVRFLTIGLAALIALAGCSETLTIRSEPSQARVLLNGIDVGETPLRYRTRNVRPLHYKVTKDDYPSVEGDIRTRVARGRVIGAVFTLGIVAIARPIRTFVPREIDVYLGPQQPPLALLNLYDVASATALSGECEIPKGNCWLSSPSGETCVGEYVREIEGKTSVRGSAGAIAASTGVTIAAAGVSAGAEVENLNRGAAVFRCSDWIAECDLVIGTFAAEGHGTCKDTNGVEYKLMMRPKEKTVRSPRFRMPGK